MQKLVSFLFRNSRGITILAILAGLITGLCNTLAIGLINKGIELNINAPKRLIFIFIGVCIALPLTRVVSQILLTYLSQKVVFQLRMHLAKRILSAPLRTLERKGPGSLLTILTGDIDVISNVMAGIPNACMSLAIVISGFGYMVYLYWPAAIASTVTVLLGVGVFALVVARANRYLSLARDEQDNLYDHFNALINGNKELKIHQMKRRYFMSDMVGTASDSFRHNQVMGSAWYAGAASMGQLMLFVTVGLLVFALPHYVTSIPSNVLTGYAMILMYMVLPLEALTNLVPMLSMAGISLQKVESLGADFDKECKESEEDVSPEPNWKELSYKGITHSYYREQEDDLFTMGPIDVAFKPGELVFVVGGNGSGKTTLAKMLLGLYIPDEGEILFDGDKIEDTNRNLFRQQFSAIFSDFYLFQDMMGLCPPEKDESARDFLERLHLSKKVAIKDGRLSSVELSQGQRKRLALLTAYLEDRPIYMFDEWAADQDPLFKEIFYKILLPGLKQKGKTVIVISHDDRYFETADRIIKLENGQIVLDTRDTSDLSILLSAHA